MSSFCQRLQKKVPYILSNNLTVTLKVLSVKLSGAKIKSVICVNIIIVDNKCSVTM